MNNIDDNKLSKNIGLVFEAHVLLRSLLMPRLLICLARVGNSGLDYFFRGKFLNPALMCCVFSANHFRELRLEQTQHSQIKSWTTVQRTVHHSSTVCHAELNAIMNKNSADVKGCTMYVALFPCNECAKLIIQAGIKDVIYLSDKYHDTPEMTASRRLLNLAGITYKQFQPKQGRIVIDFNSINHPGLKTSSGLGGVQSP
uniref:dCMP deaminase n=1 Tax=Cyprinus carpio TaxID=7962 RepID=A0A8C1VGR5_CYPCA